MAIPTGKLVTLLVLPQRYNPDSRGQRRRVEPDKFEQPMEEIAATFGGGVVWRFGGGSPRGFWWDRGVLYKDEVNVVEVDIPNDPGAKSWLTRYARDTLIPRFGQKAIYIKFVGPIEVELVRIRKEE